MPVPHIVIVGGGAGGLELACQLGRQLGKRKLARITLIDQHPTHLWKPLLHEVATGALDSQIDEVSYQALASQNNFHFCLGKMSQLYRDQQQLGLAELIDEQGESILPARAITYDYLVLALGSVTNDFATPGVKEHCLFLDKTKQAERFHKLWLNKLLQLSEQLKHDPSAKLPILIVGGGATGVELSAELMHAADSMNHYGLEHINADVLELQLIEAGPRLLPALPERISHAVAEELAQIGVTVHCQARVVSAELGTLHLADGRTLHGALMVWAAGIKGADWYPQLGLTTVRSNQFLVNAYLQSVDDARIYALGDCCACPQGDKFVPPRAQSAHQMATTVATNLRAAIAGQALSEFVYKDHGSLVSLSQHSAIGTLMGSLSRGSLKVEGRLARWMYVSLYRLHQMALYGWFKTALIALTHRIHRVTRPKLKLH